MCVPLSLLSSSLGSTDCQADEFLAPQRRPLESPFAYILPSSNVTLAKELFRPVFKAAMDDPDLDIQFRYVVRKSWVELWHGCASSSSAHGPLLPFSARLTLFVRPAAFTEALESLDEVGIPLLLGGRLVPRDVVEQKSDELATFLASSPTPAIVHLGASALSLLLLLPACLELLLMPGPTSQSRVVQSRSSPTSPRRSTRLGAAPSCAPSFSPSQLQQHSLTCPSPCRHIDLPVSWPSSAPLSTIHHLSSFLTSHTLALGSIAASLGHPQASYASESDYYEKEWQNVWHGEDNYARLLEAKREWDPDGVFSARKAVGSEIVGW